MKFCIVFLLFISYHFSFATKILSNLLIYTDSIVTDITLCREDLANYLTIPKSTDREMA